MWKVRNYWPAILWAGVILGLCAIPGGDLPDIGWASLLNLDKIVHAAVFLVLFIAIWLGGRSKGVPSRKVGAVALILCAGYGWATELLQQYVFQDRTADVMDFIANAVGSVLGMIIAATPLGNWLEKSVTS